MKDRVPVNPGRVLITPENGAAAFYATMTRADNPTQEGTPLNKNSLLKDATAALFGLGADAVPDDVLAAIKSVLNDQASDIAAGAKIAAGSYVGTGTYGASNPCSLTFDFSPLYIIFSTTGGRIGFAATGANYMEAVHTSVSSSGGYAAGWRISFTWNGTAISWYNTASALNQFNEADTVYTYIAIG